MPKKKSLKEELAESFARSQTIPEADTPARTSTIFSGVLGDMLKDINFNEEETPAEVNPMPSPIVNPTASAMVNPIVNPSVNPMTSAMTNATVNPMVNPTASAIPSPIVNPIVNPIPSPIVNPMPSAMPSTSAMPSAETSAETSAIVNPIPSAITPTSAMPSAETSAIVNPIPSAIKKEKKCTRKEASKSPKNAEQLSLFSEDSTPETKARVDCISMGTNERLLLATLANEPSGFISLRSCVIPMDNGKTMCYGSKRYAFDNLINVGAVLQYKKIYNGRTRGMLYKLSPVHVSALFDLCPNLQATKTTYEQKQDGSVNNTYGDQLAQCLAQYLAQSNVPPYNPLLKEDRQTDCLSHAREEENTQPHEEIYPLSSHPEYAFWRKQGLSENMILRWQEEFQLDTTLMDQYLRFAAYELSQPGSEIKSPQNWFYKVLKNSGGYKRPADYISHEEKIQQEKKEILAQREQYLKTQKELEEREKAVRIDEGFEEMMANRETSQLYKILFARVPKIAARQPDGPACRACLRIAYRDYIKNQEQPEPQPQE